ncbi:MAG: hypothetical protein Q8K59_06095 [Nitrosomonas sp.]|nr:hypothetical protein [Nitrosomonas sp.]MDP1950654.1 hypothetical protein [Nitrosomonas sp.]
MKIKTGKYLAVLPILALLVSCAQMSTIEAQNADTQKVAQNAKTYSDHENLSNRYDNMVKEIRVKVEEKKKLLEQYTTHSYLYGRKGQELQSHTLANLRNYERAAEEASNRAAFHREIAAELAKQEYAKPAETPSQRGNPENKVKLNLDPRI